LSDITTSKTQLNHEAVHDAGNISDAEVLVQRRLIRESIAGERRNNDVVRECFGGVLVFENGQDLQKL